MSLFGRGAMLLRGMASGIASILGNSATSQGGQAGGVVGPSWGRINSPVWTGRQRPSAKGQQPFGSVTTAKQQKRQRDRKMREGLPRMSGRQWTKLRKLMYRRARAVHPLTQETSE